MTKLFPAIIIISLIFFGCSKNSDKDQNSSGQKQFNSANDTDPKNESSGNLSGAGFKEKGVDFNVQYEEPRKIYKIMKEDLNGNGNNEIIILSIAREEEYNSYDYYNFDMIEMFSLDDEEKIYKKILSDTVDYSKEIIIESLEGNINKQIMIKTYTGGNNVISSSGMFIYGMTSPQNIEQLKFFDSGNPEINDINNDNKKEILISDEYTGVIPNVNIINYIKDIYSFDKNKLIRSNLKFGSYFDARIDALMERYKIYKDKLLMGMEARDFSQPVYYEAVEIILNYHAKGDAANMLKFWNEEKDFLQRNLSYDEFIDLKNLVTKLQPIAEIP